MCSRQERRAVPDQASQLERLKAALADRYRIERELGRGGMAIVWLVRRGSAICVLGPPSPTA
jgi:hypothetical protein